MGLKVSGVDRFDCIIIPMTTCTWYHYLPSLSPKICHFWLIKGMNVTLCKGVASLQEIGLKTLSSEHPDVVVASTQLKYNQQKCHDTDKMVAHTLHTVESLYSRHHCALIKEVSSCQRYVCIGTLLLGF